MKKYFSNLGTDEAVMQFLENPYIEEEAVEQESVRNENGGEDMSMPQWLKVTLVIVLVLVVCGLITWGSVTLLSDVPTVAPTLAPAPTVAPTPTVLPTPIRVVVPPTALPMPTVAPTPTATVTPGMDVVAAAVATAIAMQWPTPVASPPNGHLAKATLDGDIFVQTLLLDLQRHVDEDTVLTDSEHRTSWAVSQIDSIYEQLRMAGNPFIGGWSEPGGDATIIPAHAAFWTNLGSGACEPLIASGQISVIQHSGCWGVYKTGAASVQITSAAGRWLVLTPTDAVDSANPCWSGSLTYVAALHPEQAVAFLDYVFEQLGYNYGQQNLSNILAGSVVWTNFGSTAAVPAGWIPLTPLGGGYGPFFVPEAASATTGGRWMRVCGLPPTMPSATSPATGS